jgi:hypothetical protein
VIVFSFGSIQHAAFLAKPIAFRETLSDDRQTITAELDIEGKIIGADDEENADLLDWLAEVSTTESESGGLQVYRDGIWEPTAAWLDFDTYSLQRPEIRDLVIPDTSSGEVADAEFSLTLVAVRPNVAFPEIRSPLVLERDVEFTVDGSGGSPGSDFYENMKDEWTELQISSEGTLRATGLKRPLLNDFAPWSNFANESSITQTDLETDPVSGLVIQSFAVTQTCKLGEFVHGPGTCEFIWDDFVFAWSEHTNNCSPGYMSTEPPFVGLTHGQISPGTCEI